MRLFSFLFLLSVFSLNLSAQPFFNLDTSVPVSENNAALKNPWVGGMNSCQFSTIDLNLDGIQDLFVFDRTGGRVTTYLNNGTANTVDYVFAPGYRNYFHFIHDWVLLRDYNCDGKKDIFTYSSGGMAVYRNISSPDHGLDFELVTQQVLSNYNPNMINLYISPVDIPVITDMDGDGDLDVLTYDIFGQKMEYHKNLSEEMYGNCDSLVYQLDTPCWGNYEESQNSFNVTLGITCKGVTEPQNPPLITQHTGSCEVTFDNDADGDQDLLLADVSFRNMNLLTNGGDANTANLTAQDPAFVSDDVTVEMDLMPCGFYEDVDNDNVRDLVISPDLTNISENFTSIWWYKNTGADNQPNFVFQKNNFLQDEMIEVGEGAYPVFFDADADGLQDLLIGNYGYFTNSGNYPGKLAYYRNVGTTTQPSFSLVTRDCAGLSANGWQGIVATFGDIDDDGVDEMIVGETTGAIHLFENSASPGQPANFSLSQANYQGIDPGQFSAPQLFDVDGDGLLDLIIGERNGNLNYYYNTGTATNPIFTLYSESFGGVDVRQPGYNVGYAAPFMFKYQNQLRLLVGSEAGDLYMYKDIENHLTDTFALESSHYIDIWEGIQSSIAGADINNDGLMDFVIGNYAGGVTFFRGDTVLNPPVGIISHAAEDEMQLYPNPAQDKLNISWPGSNKPAVGEIYDMEGQRLSRWQLPAISVKQIDISALPDGFYILHILSNDGAFSKKFIVNH